MPSNGKDAQPQQEPRLCLVALPCRGRWLFCVDSSTLEPAPRPRGRALYAECHSDVLLCLCRGHNGKVRSLAWSANDAHLVSCGTEGAVYRWKLRTFKRDRENVLKVCAHPQSLKINQAESALVMQHSPL